MNNIEQAAQQLLRRIKGQDGHRLDANLHPTSVAIQQSVSAQWQENRRT